MSRLTYGSCARSRGAVPVVYAWATRADEPPDRPTPREEDIRQELALDRGVPTLDGFQLRAQEQQQTTPGRPCLLLPLTLLPLATLTVAPAPPSPRAHAPWGSWRMQQDVDADLPTRQGEHDRGLPRGVVDPNGSGCRSVLAQEEVDLGLGPFSVTLVSAA